MLNTTYFLQRTGYIACFLLFAWTATAQWSAGANGSIPQGALVAGYENGQEVYLAAANYAGRPSISSIMRGWSGALIIYGNKTVYAPNYVIYTGNGTWQDARGGIPKGAVKYEFSGAGKNIYPVRKNHNGALLIGWAKYGRNEAEFFYQNQVIQLSGYEILVESDAAQEEPAAAPPPTVVVAPAHQEQQKPQVVVAPAGNRNNKPAPGGGNTGGISGIIFIDGHRMSPRDGDVNFTVTNTANNRVVKHLELDNDNGEFDLTGLPPGDYLIEVKAGYQEPSQDRGEGFGAPYRNYLVEPNPLVITVKAGIVLKQNFSIR